MTKTERTSFDLHNQSDTAGTWLLLLISTLTMDGILMYFRCKQTLPAKTSCSDVGARKQRIIVSSMFFVHFVLTLCVVLEWAVVHWMSYNTVMITALAFEEKSARLFIGYSSQLSRNVIYSAGWWRNIIKHAQWKRPFVRWHLPCKSNKTTLTLPVF